jgi:hypothetical protein
VFRVQVDSDPDSQFKDVLREPPHPSEVHLQVQCSDLLYAVHRSNRWKLHRSHRNGVPWHPLS